jgi:hypothetical protein
MYTFYLSTGGLSSHGFINGELRGATKRIVSFQKGLAYFPTSFLLLTINAPLILKMRDIIFFLRANYT